MSRQIRSRLVAAALEWQDHYGVAPAITSALSEYDAARLVGCTDDEYSRYMQDQTAVQRGHDFIHKGLRYQVKANRPSGKPGSRVTMVAKPKNYEWDHLIWILYNREYELQEAWIWGVTEYRNAFEPVKRLSPAHMRFVGGKCLWGSAQQLHPADAIRRGRAGQ